LTLSRGISICICFFVRRRAEDDVEADVDVSSLHEKEDDEYLQSFDPSFASPKRGEIDSLCSFCWSCGGSPIDDVDAVDVDVDVDVDAVVTTTREEATTILRTKRATL